MHEYKHVVYVNPRKIHSSLDYLHRKMPIATCVSGHTALLRKRETRLHTWRPCPATAAVYRSHGHIAACVGEGAQQQLGLPDNCIESVVVPDRNESFALVASQKSPRSWASAVVQMRVCGHKFTCTELFRADYYTLRECFSDIDGMCDKFQICTQSSEGRWICP